MWDLAMEILGKGAAVPYERCVMASCGQAPAGGPHLIQGGRRREAEDLEGIAHASASRRAA
jgi:hypothetical protein